MAVAGWQGAAAARSAVAECGPGVGERVVVAGEQVDEDAVGVGGDSCDAPGFGDGVDFGGEADAVAEPADGDVVGGMVFAVADHSCPTVLYVSAGVAGRP
jgi:hypothetical protein